MPRNCANTLSGTTFNGLAWVQTRRVQLSRLWLDGVSLTHSSQKSRHLSSNGQTIAPEIPRVSLVRKFQRMIFAYGKRQLLKKNYHREVAYVRDEFRWGYQIESSQSRQQWFKLDLDPSQKQSTYLSKKYPDRLAAPPGYTSSAEKQSTDYLTALKNHVEQVLKNKLPESALKSAPIEYIVSKYLVSEGVLIKMTLDHCSRCLV